MTALLEEELPVLESRKFEEPLEATNEELVIAAQRGESDAFGELANRFERMVYSVCWQRLRNHAEAQEVTQDVFIKAFREVVTSCRACGVRWLVAIDCRTAVDQSQHPTSSVDRGRTASDGSSGQSACRAAWIRCWRTSGTTNCGTAWDSCPRSIAAHWWRFT